MRTKQMSLPLIPSSREISTMEPFLSSVVRYLETTDSYKKHMYICTYVRVAKICIFMPYICHDIYNSLMLKNIDININNI